MRTLLVGYDLNKPGKDYSKLIEKLKGFSNWWHCLDSTWLIKTNLSPVQMRDALISFVDRNDELLVIDVTGREAAWVGFDAECSSWLKTNL